MANNCDRISGMNRNELDPLIAQTNEKLSRLGIEAGLFDLDDALIFTSVIFRRFMAEYTEAVVRLSGVDYDIFAERLKIINDEEYQTHRVNPHRWETVAERLAREFPLASEAIYNCRPILYKIYETVPKVREGATSVLNGLKAGGRKIGIVTHSMEKWAWWKLEMTGLIRYQDAVVIADPNGEKTSAHWGRCAQMLGVTGEKCFVFGDNLKGDVINGMAIGARGIWMPSPWSVYRQGIVPPGVVEITELTDFWEGVLRLK